MITISRQWAVHDASPVLLTVNSLFYLPPTRAGVNLAAYALPLWSWYSRFWRFFFFHTQSCVRGTSAGRYRGLCYDSGRATVALRWSRHWRHYPCRLVDKISLTCSTRKGKISLFELSSKQLESAQIGTLYFFVHRMDHCLRRVVLAPDRGQHRTSLPVERDCGHSIASCGFDRGHIEAECVVCVVRTANVEIGMALLACDTSTVVALAQLASCIIPQSRCTDTLDHIEADCVAELCFGVP
jgi:hypothetical protein